ncbi:MAG: 30S ribosomal protein S13 [Candidatus Micrarchaeota archaeon]
MAEKRKFKGKDDKAKDSAAPSVVKKIKKFKTAGRENKEFKGIIRLVGKDIDGHYEVKDALKLVRGIGQNLSKSIINAAEKLGIVSNELIGNLTEQKLADLENLIKNLKDFNVKAFMLNRPNDIETGKDTHYLGNDLRFAVKQDIDREKITRSYKGWRHATGQRVRGQHSRSTGRSGLTIGVLKKALKQQKTDRAKKE